jgi:thioredoxin reductase (NADPH)
MTEKEKIEDIVILGSGPAGLSAAIYAARADLNPLVLTGLQLGGQAALTNEIENYPGFPDGIGGIELGELFQKQAERFGARIEFDLATKVDFSKRPFRIFTDNGEILAKTVIIAVGADPNHLNIPGEKELTGRGVSYCGTCDAWFFKDKIVMVVGGGDSALEEGIFITRFAKKVTIIHRRDEFRASTILQKRAKKNTKLDFILNSEVVAINGDGKVESIDVINNKTKAVTKLNTDGFFIFIGHSPNTAMFKDQLELDNANYIQTDQLMQTNVPGIFVAGEAADPHFRQVVTSAGMGAGAAIQAVRFLEQES